MTPCKCGLITQLLQTIQEIIVPRLHDSLDFELHPDPDCVCHRSTCSVESDGGVSSNYEGHGNRANILDSTGTKYFHLELSEKIMLLACGLVHKFV